MEDNRFGFENLILWQKAREFKKEVRQLSKKLPNEEKYRLTDQLIRSSRSVNALIAEGHGRYTWPDQTHYCVQARGSLSETINHLVDAYDEEYITQEELDYFKIKGKELERLINGYLDFLRKKQKDGK
jgi:four helix bundle protein